MLKLLYTAFPRKATLKATVIIRITRSINLLRIFLLYEIFIVRRRGQSFDNVNGIQKESTDGYNVVNYSTITSYMLSKSLPWIFFFFFIPIAQLYAWYTMDIQ